MAEYRICLDETLEILWSERERYTQSLMDGSTGEDWTINHRNIFGCLASRRLGWELLQIICSSLARFLPLLDVVLHIEPGYFPLQLDEIESPHSDTCGLEKNNYWRQDHVDIQPSLSVPRSL